MRVMLGAWLQVDTMDGLFKEFREEPPLYKNQPPVAGAIHWEKSLFHRIKHTIIRFMTLEEMMQSDQGKAVSTPALWCWVGLKLAITHWLESILCCQFDCLLLSFIHTYCTCTCIFVHTLIGLCVVCLCCSHAPSTCTWPSR